MRRRVRATGGCAALLALMVIPIAGSPLIDAAAQQPAPVSTERELRLDFEDAAVGSPPPGFTAALTGKGKPVRWVVVEDTSAPAGSKVIAETSGDRTSNRFPLAIFDGFHASNVSVSVRFKPVSGEVDQAAGLMVRVKDANNYYIARANALEDNVRLYKVVNGRRQQFAGTDIEVPNGSWQTLGLSTEGNRISVSLDGNVLFSAADDTFTEAGQVGIWTKADSLTHFDEFTIRRLP